MKLVNNCLIIIQCRFDSSRLPGKILKELKPGLTCLEYLIQRLSKANYNCIVATSDREVDLKIIRAVNELRDTKKYPHLRGFYCGSYEDLANRLYEAAEGYEYLVRVTGDDIFIDTDILNRMVDYALANNFDYVYPKDLIRGCDSDVFKRYALKQAMEMYDTSSFESIEFLFKNNKFKTHPYEVPISYKQDFSLTMDTSEDWKLMQAVFNKLYKIHPMFSTWDIIEFFSRNPYLKNINKVPKVSVYIVYRDYPVNWLHEALTSLREQVYTDYEVILIDYGSKQIHHFLKLVNDKTIQTYYIDDKTFIEAIEFATNVARGKYIMRLDADDILKPHALKNMVGFLEKNDFYSAVIPNYDVVDDKGKLIRANKEGNVLDLPTCALIEKKKYKYVNFLEGQEFRDGTNLVETFKQYDMLIGYLRLSLFNYRVHSKSITHGQYTEKEINDMDNVIKNG